MKDNFDRIMTFILDAEGGFVEDKDDPGGATKYGISKRSFPKEDIKNLTLDRAKEIYKSLYWNAIKGDSIPVPLDLFMMDTAVNCGVGTTLKLAKLSTSADDFLFNRIQYYLNVIKAHPTLRKYESNWIGRALKCRKEAATWGA